MNNALIIRQFTEQDALSVRDLFVRINRALAPVGQEATFETYITSSLQQEIDRIPQYYGEKGGTFWVAMIDDDLVGMFGLEPSGDKAMELRRMYVNPDWRRQGIAQKMLRFAESYCRTNDIRQLDLSTSEIQSAALAFYRDAGYQLVREEIADAPSNKTIGGGIKRYHFKKEL